MLMVKIRGRWISIPKNTDELSEKDKPTYG